MLKSNQHRSSITEDMTNGMLLTPPLFLNERRQGYVPHPDTPWEVLCAIRIFVYSFFCSYYLNIVITIRNICKKKYFDVNRQTLQPQCIIF